MRKTLRVIALPTENKTHLLRNTYKFTPEYGNPWEYRSQILENAVVRGYEFNHLYFVAPSILEDGVNGEEAKYGDWMIHEHEGLHKFQEGCIGSECRKVIVTTNPDLWSVTNEIPTQLNQASFNIKHQKDGHFGGEDEKFNRVTKPLPKIPADFLESFCKHQGIWTVDLEYEETWEKEFYPNGDYTGVKHAVYKPKLNSQGEVICHWKVQPEQDDTSVFNHILYESERENVITKLKAYLADIHEEGVLKIKNIPEELRPQQWFDKNYPKI